MYSYQDRLYAVKLYLKLGRRLKATLPSGGTACYGCHCFLATFCRITAECGTVGFRR